MRIGLALPQYDYSLPEMKQLTWSAVVDHAVAAEVAGLGSVWLADHLFLSIEKYGAPPGDHFGFEPIVALADLAVRTDTVRLGTLVLCGPLRPPAWLAKNLATVDVLSEGRLTVGVGAGWFEPEFEVAGVPFRSPGRRLADLENVIAEMRTTWRDGTDPPCFPAPVQKPGPPVWVGGKGDRLVALAARCADGWNTAWTWTRDDYRKKLEVLERECVRAGRDPDTVELSLALYTLVGETERDLARRFEAMAERTPKGVLSGIGLEEWRVGHLVGTVEQVREQLSEWQTLGVTTLIAGLGALPFSVTDPDAVHLLASAVPEE